MRRDPATMSAQTCGIFQFNKGQHPMMEKKIVMTTPNDRSDDPLISSSRVIISWTVVYLLSVMNSSITVIYK